MKDRVIQVVQPNILNQNHFLFFELDDKSRFNFKNDVDSGIAGSSYYTITNDNFSLDQNYDSLYYESYVHKVLEHEDFYLMVIYSHYSEDIYSRVEIINKNYIYKHFTEEDISRFERTFL